MKRCGTCKKRSPPVELPREAGKDLPGKNRRPYEVIVH